MAQPRTSDCPLCGAKIGAARLWAEKAELIHEELGVYSTQCPYCQGYLEIKKQDDCLLIGYLIGKGDNIRFEIALSLKFEQAISSTQSHL
ncbi:MAG: hypothetical protein RIR18_1011 [Pseudomonadota bacterium]|jgi:hypothetical protein